MRIIRCKDYDEISKRAADIVAAQLIIKPNSVLGLPTGNTPLGLYRELVDRFDRGEIDFSQAVSFNLDEYYGLSKDDPDSYYFYMNQNLFSKVNLKQTFIPDGSNSDAKSETEAYERKIEEFGGIDLQVLGIGRNGHIGFNEPADELCPVTHKVMLTESTIEANSVNFEDPSKMPKAGLTMGMGSILKARKIILLANGAAKARALADLFKNRITTKNPATFLLLHPDVTIIADAAALGE